MSAVYYLKTKGRFFYDYNMGFDNHAIFFRLELKDFIEFDFSRFFNSQTTLINSPHISHKYPPKRISLNPLDFFIIL